MSIWSTVLCLMLIGPLLVILLLDSLLRAWLLLVTRRAVAAPGLHETGPSAFAVVIPAHDEGAVIGATVRRLRPQIPAGLVAVIADNCTDDTAAVAGQAGARVWERHDSGERGKGAALRWFLAAAAQELVHYDAIAIFDADSIVDERFLDHAGAALARGADVVQGFVQPLSRGSASDVAAYSELLSQLVDDTARVRLGWPVPLRGTGMVFRREVLESLLPHMATKVEDVEMSLLLAAEGVLVQFVPGAVVGDPKPANTRWVATQRARWLQGQGEVLRYHSRLVWGLLSGLRPGYISLVFATLLKPKTLLFLLKGLWLALSLLLPPSWGAVRSGIVALAAFAMCTDVLYYVLGLRLIENPGRYMRALALAPLYLAMWLWSVVLSLISADPWLRVLRDDERTCSGHKQP